MKASTVATISIGTALTGLLGTSYPLLISAAWYHGCHGRSRANVTAAVDSVRRLL